ncbi:phospho-sugar mutase [Motilibacter aurantiacus]|uniref:phospho-sugar mutase n=1 Tax=Motilibacter aurantiacus TaxID=2714955 RepID=UPI001409E27E|nr:phospho-sugar mutase [Motilibacter aurantiacus]NHC43901.1 phospho-sugar mutase [Motilibacter aurantiacus]
MTDGAHEHRQSEDTVDVLELARAWLAEDPDPATRGELQALLAEPDPAAALGDRFTARLEFGTAGLRGALGAGPNRMNRLTVLRATAGLVAYLRSRAARRVVIGYDARSRSADFAQDAASVVNGAGMEALLLPGPLPTPVLAFAVRHLTADAGIMITASHNPAADNGYKVYLGDGSQIVSPADAEISAEIDAVGPVMTIPRGDGWAEAGEDVVEAYVSRAASVVAAGGPRDLRIVYTPLHGVGRDTALAAFARAGFPEPYVVAEQAEPDPAFPTVAFPNPEEPGAMDLALAAAAREQADIVLANDPDADRLAVAVRTSGRHGRWTVLRGDEVGALLATHLARRAAHAGRAGGVLATSIVSSSLLCRIAAAHGMGFAETLTGFKWISRVPGLTYGYEEALGYCVDPEGVRDKDGITAALVVAELAASLKAEGRSLLDLLDEIAVEHGLHATDQLSVRVSQAARIRAAVDRLRQGPPQRLGGRAVTAVDDLAAGGGGLPPTDGLRFHLEGGARVIVRPSGTEPKLKCYLEVVEQVRDGDVDSAGKAAAAALEALRADVGQALQLS